jgi:4-diphosphocytidyl-2-C-methyl-D-erythritol kinase
MRSLIVSAPAKINLLLGVGAKRPDGYHRVTTVLHALDLVDTLILTPADELLLSSDVDLGIPAEQNLAYRAAAEFSRAFEVDVLIHIALHKRIPSGAGLGGGSSDAAGVLAGLAHWGSLPLADPRLQAIAAQLGADVPFFLGGGAAVMEGRGDELTRGIEPFSVPVVVVKPAPGVVTAHAYAAFDREPEAPGDLEPVLAACLAKDPRALGAALANNMTVASSKLVPEIAEITRWLSGADGVLGAAMTGSGSAVFAMCETDDVAGQLAVVARQKGLWAAATRTRERGVAVELGPEIA